STPTALDRAEDLGGRRILAAYDGDARDPHLLEKIFSTHRIATVVHFAARKAVGESVELPLDYDDSNVGATVALLKAMTAHGVHNLVFSSSCSIYGEGDGQPLTEDSPARPASPYARSKWICERVIEDTCARHPQLSAISLRYFNPAGAHASGLLGEDPLGVPGNVMPYLMQVAVGRRPELTIFGGDYPTPDGTCVRDYLHVVDVAVAHRIAAEHLADGTGHRSYNLGTGVGTSVRELVTTFTEVSGVDIPIRIAGRRPGDVPALVADPAKVCQEWGWQATRDVAAMCADAWRFQRQHPQGLGPLARPRRVSAVTERPQRISVIGTGYLGAVHAACMAELGHEVVGVDTDAAKIAALADGRAPFYEPGLPEILARNVAAGRLRFSTSLADAAESADVHFLCVGTPQRADSHAADLRHLHAAADGLAPHLRRSALVAGKSTVPVGTAASLAVRIAALAPAETILAWNPEFLREGFAVADTLTPDRLVIGTEAGRGSAILRELYAPILAGGTPLIETDLATAELVKVSANAFLATKISFINAMSEVCDAAGADVATLAQAIGHDERIGHRFLAAGLGFGGGCLPKDIRAFGARAEELGVGGALAFLREVDEVNMRARQRIVALARALAGGSLLGRNVAVLGAAFKPDSDDVRDSPALNVAASLQLQGAQVRVHDPEAIDNARAVFPSLDYVLEAEKACEGAHLVLHLTEWAEYRELDPARLRDIVCVPVILDGRNALDAARWRTAGWTVRAPGRAG
ncbi:MAG: UDPglucose 6-dehydrogenase, partial [Cryptosporangiaceae bacterium]|nr:UDPglucose 6-dehydrogenase [Cryptosporangiaceae bacterium]